MSLPSRERGLKSQAHLTPRKVRPSLPSRERGLKYHASVGDYIIQGVAPLAGAWIEIRRRSLHRHGNTSLPSRERGLKFINMNGIKRGNIVAPLAGAWIEMEYMRVLKPYGTVAPLAGAWIEIRPLLKMKNVSKSLPSRERGLKSCLCRL